MDTNISFAKFDAEQYAALCAATELYDFDMTEKQFADTTKIIYNGDYLFVEGVQDEYSLGYSQRDITGVDEALEGFFDWEGFGESIMDDYEYGGFTDKGWLGLIHK